MSINYSPEPIGIPVYTTGMANWLCNNYKWHVTVKTGMPHYPWWSIPGNYAVRLAAGVSLDEVLNNVIVERVKHYIPVVPLTGIKRMRMDASWLIATFLRSFFTGKKPEALIIIAPPFLGGLIGIFLGWRWRIPVIYHIQDLQVDAALNLKLLPTWMGGVLLRCEQFILRHVDMVSTISQTMADRIRKKAITRRPVCLFPNWVNVQVMHDGGLARQFRAQWSATSQVVIMYSGNLGAKQGLDVLLEAVALLPSSLSIVVVIAGAGPERMALEQTVSQRRLTRVIFQDLVPVEQLGDFLRAADIHVIPQRRAAAGLVMPSKLLNIMAVGRPTVVTAEHGTDLATIIQQSGGGTVAEPESATALAQALEAMVCNSNQREHCGQSARNYILARYTIDQVVGTFARRVSTLAHRHRCGKSA